MPGNSVARFEGRNMTTDLDAYYEALRCARSARGHMISASKEVEIKSGLYWPINRDCYEYLEEIDLETLQMEALEWAELWSEYQSDANRLRTKVDRFSHETR